MIFIWDIDIVQFSSSDPLGVWVLMDLISTPTLELIHGT